VAEDVVGGAADLRFAGERLALDPHDDDLHLPFRRFVDDGLARRARLDELEGTNSNQGEAIGALEKDLAAANSDLARLKGVAGDLERLMGNAKANQAQVERVADTLNRLDLEMNRLAKRVEANEGWVESINAFRRQVNASISQLEGTVRTLQQGPAAGGPGA